MILHNSRNKEAIHAKTISFLDMLCYGYTARTKKYAWGIEFSVPHFFVRLAQFSFVRNSITLHYTRKLSIENEIYINIKAELKAKPKVLTNLDMLCYGYTVRTKKYDRTKHMFCY